MKISECTLHNPCLKSLHFLHIPKTAGTSLRSWLLDLYRESDWLPCHFLKELEQMAIKDIYSLQNYYFFSGHLGITWYNFLPASPYTFTWLRQPIKREISQYLYLKSMISKLLDLPLNPFSQDYIKTVDQLSLVELLQSQEHKENYDNLQVRCLAGVFPSKTEIPIPCNQEMLELAKKNLLDLCFFGITEAMDASIVLFNDFIGCYPRDFNLYLNKMTKDHGLSETELEIIRDANFYDLQLYDFAQSVFEKRLHNFYDKVNLSRDFLPNNFKMKNQVIRTFLRNNFQEKQKNIPRLKNINFDFSEAVFLDNWHPRFYYEPVQRWLRWTGHETTAYIYLPLAENTNFKITFTVFYGMKYEIIQSLSLWVNEINIPLNIEEIIDEQLGITIYEFTGIIHSHVITANPYSELKFVTCCTVPLEIKDGDTVQVIHVGFATNGLSIVAI